MGNRIRLISPQRIRRRQIAARIDLSDQCLQGSARPSVFHQAFTGAAAGLAGDHRLTGTGGIAGIGREPGVAAFIDHILGCDVRVGDDHLLQHRAEALADAGGAGEDMDLFILKNCQLAAAPVRQAHADAGVFHCRSQTDRLAGSHRLVVIGLDSFQCLDKTRGLIDDLTVRQDLTRPDRVAHADLPR